MLAVRVIPLLLRRDDSLVKGQQFDSWRSVGHPLQAARLHAARGVDELIVLDIGATPRNRGPDLRFVEALTRDCYMPVTVGGGVRHLQDISDLLNAGADKVAINSRAGAVLSEAAARFGSQALVAGIDVLGRKVHTHCGTTPIAWSAIEWAKRLEKLGAGEILLQRIERDGAMRGYDLRLIREVSQAINLPVIASAGCGAYSHMVKAVKAGASAVAAGAFFQWTEATPKAAAQYLHEKGIEARVA